MRKEEKELRKYYTETMSILGTQHQFDSRLRAFEKAVREDERRRMSEEQNGNN